MYITKGYGLSVDDIDWSCPADMKSYEKANILENNMWDIKNWQLGTYISCSISTIGKGKYPKKPIFQFDEKRTKKESNPIIEKMNWEIRMKMLKEEGLPLPPR